MTGSHTLRKSCIYTGRVRHRRFEPVAHRFSYRLFMMYLDLQELPELFDETWLWSARRPAPAWFRRADYFGGRHRNLASACRDLVEADTGTRPAGPVRMLTNLRTFGYCFNPVSFYYFFDAADRRVQTIVADVTNTPWNERHAYVLNRPEGEDGGVMQFSLRKQFHVSPFMGMDIDYTWHFSEPKEKLTVHMENRHDGAKIFDATLTLGRREITAGSLNLMLAHYPLLTLKVIAGIHYQALKLWLKRCPFHPHPDKGTAGAD